MTKLNIFQVNGVWQLRRHHQSDEEDDEEDQFPKQHVEGGQREPTIPNQTELLTQIFSGIQNMNTHIDRVDQGMTFDVIKVIDCVIIMLLSLLFLFLIFMLNINELLLLLLFLTLNIDKLLFNIKVLCYFSCYLFRLSYCFE